MDRHSKIAILIVLVFSALASISGNSSQTGSRGTQADKAMFRIVRAVCGAKGSHQGNRFIMEDPRSVFYLPEDRKVIVYMELEGPVGNHRIEGFWKNPSGKVASLSEFNYASQNREFNLNLTLALLESAPTGSWGLEVHVDGELVTEVNFQIVTGDRPADANPPKALLSPAEVYQRAMSVSATIEKLGRNGESLGILSGFVGAQGMVISAFQAIEGASRIRVIFTNGTRRETDQILSWSRRYDYAAIQLNTDPIPALAVAPENSWEVGDRVTFLEFAPEGNRVLSEVKVVGKPAFPAAGERLSLSVVASPRAVGGPLLSQYGEVIGHIGGPLSPLGSRSMEADIFAPGAGMDPGSRSTLAVPFSLVGSKRTNPTTLEELARNGTILLPVVGGKHILYAQLTHRIEKGGGRQRPVDASSQFLRRDGTIGLFIMWDPKEKLKAIVDFQVYDSENRMIGPFPKVKDTKVNFQPGRQVSTSWDLNISKLPAGVYRIDARINQVPCWRSYFGIVD